MRGLRATDAVLSRVSRPWFALAVAVGLSSGCVGPFAPSRIHELTVTPDGCGAYVVEVDAESGGRTLEIVANGAVVESMRVHGRQRLRWLGFATAGARTTVEARVGGAVAAAAATQPAYEPAVTFDPPSPVVYQGQDARVHVGVGRACADLVSPTLSWRFDSAAPTQRALAPVAREVDVVVPPDLSVGEHALFLTATLTPVRTEDHRVVVWVEPPCADDDGDGLSTCDGDCDDADRRVRRGCTSRPDDLDGDGHRSRRSGGDDCHDQRSDLHPDQVDGVDQDGDGAYVTDGVDQDCDKLVDEDVVGPADCDDSRPDVHPGRGEAPVPNGRDDNCDGRVDEGTRVYDDDGDGTSEDQGDCDDNDAQRGPGLPERADCRDQDCDGAIDEGVSPVERDDAYEANDTSRSPHDLHTRSSRSFERTLDLVTRSSSDEEWFAFWSDDGDFDTWGIFVGVVRIGERSRYQIDVLDDKGVVQSGKVVTSDGDWVRVTGRGFSSDSGTYRLRVRPLETPHDWCPLTVRLTSR
jgi:hypothetical protein